MSWAEVKHALNSTLGTDEFESLDKLFSIRLAQFYSYQKQIVFSSPGSYSYTVPDGIYKIYIAAAGGGGGGSGASYDGTSQNCHGSGGGGGAAVFNYEFPVNPGQIFSISVGAAGKGGSSGTSSSFSPKPGTDGEDTVISGVITLPGGKGATVEEEISNIWRTYGGEPGGTGGGKGGRGGYYNGSSTVLGSSGSPGIIGSGGAANSNDSGGGGGSLGNGGTGNYYENRGGTVRPPTKGGGGGGGTFEQGFAYDTDGLDGADGYVMISLIPIKESDLDASQATDTSVTSYTETELMNAYREGVESIG